MGRFTVQSKAHQEVIDITEEVAAHAASVGDGTLHLFTSHTTCALTILIDEGRAARARGPARAGGRGVRLS